MPAIDFPAAPAVNDEYSFEGRTWLWNSTGWEVKAFVGGGANDLQEFTSSGTWTKPAGASFVLVEAWGAGGGGGSGRRGAAGTDRIGGSGGGGGAYVYRMFKAAELGSTATVTIGAGGTGGAAITANDTSGNAGTGGGDTTFGSLLTAYGGGNGLGGTAITQVSGAGGGGTLGRPTTDSSAGGVPSFEASGGAVYGNAFGGGGGGNTTRGGSSGFGGGGGAMARAGFSGISGGSSTYGGAGGNSGSAISTTNIGSGSSSAVGIGLYGSGGTPGIAGSTTNATVNSLVYGNSLFVAHIGNGFIASSSDGTTWTAQATFLPVAVVTGLLYDGTRWLVWTSGDVYTATSLSSWTLQASTATNFTWIAHNSGTYVGVGASGSIRTSTDRVTWTSRTSGTTESLSHVIHDGTRWVAVGANGVSLTSTDATTWTLVTTASSGSWNRVASTGTTMVATSSLTPFAWRSTNSGASWSPVTTTLTASGQVIYAGSQFIITQASIIYTSSAGDTWTTQTDGTTDTYDEIAYSGSVYFVGSSTSNTNVGIRSTDGVTWNASTLTALEAAGTSGGAGSGVASAGGGGGASLNGYNSGAGGNGAAGLCRVYSW